MASSPALLQIKRELLDVYIVEYKPHIDGTSVAQNGRRKKSCVAAVCKIPFQLFSGKIPIKIYNPFLSPILHYLCNFEIMVVVIDTDNPKSASFIEFIKTLEFVHIEEYALNEEQLALVNETRQDYLAGDATFTLDEVKDYARKK